MAYDNPESIHSALGDEELMLTAARVIKEARTDTEGAFAQELADGSLTEEQLAQSAAIIVCHEMGRFYPGATRAIGAKALQLSKPSDPTDFMPDRYRPEEGL